jgi:hypothetical protein
MSEGVVIALIGAGATLVAAVLTAVLAGKPGQAPPSTGEKKGVENAGNPTVDRLFDELLGRRERITCKAAYAALIGPPPEPWLPRHGEEVARVAARSRDVTVGGLPIRLDALIVLFKSAEPADPHFKNKRYTRAQWRAVFGEWIVRRK